jgi:hypothetical protein
MRVHLSPKSNNAKTGPIPVSTTEKASCPVTCGMRTACYAAAGPLGMHWSAVSAGQRGTGWAEFCDSIAALPDGQLWRHNQAGDLPSDGSRIDADALAMLVEANTGRRGFTYTHHRPADAENAMAIASANAHGFTVNLSADSVSEADALADLNIGPVACVLPREYERANAKGQWLETADEYRARVAPLPHETPAGRRIVVCPATTRDTSCAECQLCQRQRSTIVGFPAHGAAVRKADAIARRVIPIAAA